MAKIRISEFSCKNNFCPSIMCYVCTVYCALHKLSTLHAADFTMYTEHFTFHTVHFTAPTSNYTLHFSKHPKQASKDCPQIANLVSLSWHKKAEVATINFTVVGYEYDTVQ